MVFREAHDFVDRECYLLNVVPFHNMPYLSFRKMSTTPFDLGLSLVLQFQQVLQGPSKPHKLVI